MKLTIAIASLFIISSCNGNGESKKTENSTCVDSTQVEMFDAHGKAYYVWMPCDSI